MTDPATQLTTLRALRDTVTDPTQVAALDALIAQLAAIESARSHTQTIADNAQVAFAVSGDIYGDVQTGGARYLARLRGRCATMPLEGMRQQQAGDVLAISLDQLYTQLTVPGHEQ